jgi:hypothetical protein
MATVNNNKPQEQPQNRNPQKPQGNRKPNRKKPQGNRANPQSTKNTAKANVENPQKTSIASAPIEDDDLLCLTCADTIQYFAIGDDCNHHAVCGRCTIRLRCLCDKLNCVLCKVNITCAQSSSLKFLTLSSNNIFPCD